MSTPGSSPLEDQFAHRFDGERKLLLELTGLAPLESVEADNKAQWSELAQALMAQAGARYVARTLDERNQTYQKALKPRLKVIADRLKAIRKAMKKSRGRLKKAAARAGPEGAAVLASEDSYLDKTYKQLRSAGKGLDRHLNAILRRSKLERVGLEALLAAFLLAVFTIGAEKIADSVYRWAAPLSPRDCVGLWFVITLILFAAGRWFFEPRIERMLEARLHRSTKEALDLYYVERTHLEYRVAILDYETEASNSRLKSHGVL